MHDILSVLYKFNVRYVSLMWHKTFLFSYTQVSEHAVLQVFIICLFVHWR